MLATMGDITMVHRNLNINVISPLLSKNLSTTSSCLVSNSPIQNSSNFSSELCLKILRMYSILLPLQVWKKCVDKLLSVKTFYPYLGNDNIFTRIILSGSMAQSLSTG